MYMPFGFWVVAWRQCVIGLTALWYWPCGSVIFVIVVFALRRMVEGIRGNRQSGRRTLFPETERRSQIVAAKNTQGKTSIHSLKGISKGELHCTFSVCRRRYFWGGWEGRV